MKRFLRASLLAVLLVGGGVTVVAIAPVSVSRAHAYVNANGAMVAASGSAAAAADKTPTTPSCDGVFSCLEEGVSAILQVIMQLFAWLLGVAVLLLDDVVYYTILKMGDYVSSLSAVGLTWRILRDIGNIVLIFGFIAIGISVIIDYDFYGGGRKMLPMLLIIAVLLNFSLFISEAVIDVGNLFATELYTQINGGAAPQTFSLFSTDNIANDGISNKIMYQLGLQRIYNLAGKDPKQFSFGNMIFIGFLGIILFMIAAFVFFSLSFILLARFVILLLLIVVAPIGFAGLVVPKLGKTAKDWWSMLFNQTLTAPVLLLLLYIALKVITDPAFLSGLGVCSYGSTSQDCSDAATAAWGATLVHGSVSNFGGVLLSFLVAMGLLLVVVYMSSRMSAFGGSWAAKMGGKLSFGLVATSGSLIGRNFIAPQAKKRADQVRSSAFGRTVLGRRTAEFLDARTKSTYDFRNTSSFKAAASPLGKYGLQTGTATKANYADSVKKATDARVKYASSLKNTEEEKNEETRWKTQKTIQEGVQKRNLQEIDALHNVERADIEEEVKAQRAKVADLRARASAATAADKAALKAELDAEERTLSNQTDELKEMRERQQKERKEIESLHEETGKNLDKKIEAIQKAPQTQYAAYLEQNPIRNMVEGPRPKDAAEKILKEAKKSKTDKEMDTIRKLLEDSEKPAGGGEKKEDKH